MKKILLLVSILILGEGVLAGAKQRAAQRVAIKASGINNFPDPSLIIYGGAFDPPHNGHVLCTQLALTRFPQAEVLVCPAYAPVQGTTSVPKNTLLAFEERLQLARDVFKDDRLTISAIEARLPFPSRTINTLIEVQEKLNPQRLAILIGQDQLDNLKDWERVQDIIAATDIIVARRTGAAPLADSIQQLEQALDISLDWDEQRTRYAHANFSIYPLTSELLDISSSELRKNLQNNQALHEVPSAVRDFFAEK